jgi:hypothetical protein
MAIFANEREITASAGLSAGCSMLLPYYCVAVLCGCSAGALTQTLLRV